MSDSVFDLVKTLTEIPGPVGHEDAVQDYLVDNWSGFCESVQRTRVNNILAKVGGSGPRLVIFGHADELCLMIKSVSDDGYLHVWPYAADTLGKPRGWFMPLNQPALVVTSQGNIEGVFAKASGHVIGGAASEKHEVSWNDWFIDIGVRSREEAEALGAAPGTRVIWNPATRRLGQNIVGKAMDDRAALAIATLAGQALAKRDDLAYEVWIASTVQEENGLIGAASLADEMKFDRAIALDVGLTGDHPGPDKRDFPCKLGAGPTVVYQDSSCHYSRKLSDELIAAAKQNGIPVQRAVYQNYGSDSAALLRRGVESGLLTYPTRYTHSPIESVDEHDIQHAVDLLVAFATTSQGK